MAQPEQQMTQDVLLILGHLDNTRSGYGAMSLPTDTERHRGFWYMRPARVAREGKVNRFTFNRGAMPEGQGKGV